MKTVAKLITVLLIIHVIVILIIFRTVLLSTKEPDIRNSIALIRHYGSRDNARGDVTESQARGEPSILRRRMSIKQRNAEAQKLYYTLRETKVNPMNVSLIIENSKFCSRHGSAPHLLMIVPTVPDHTEIRDDIRQTTGSYTSKDDNKEFETGLNCSSSFQILFVVGLSSNESVNNALTIESEKHGDLLQGEFNDTYKALTRKMLVALQWVSHHCRNVKFVLKADEDVFADIPRLIYKLQSEYATVNDTIFGHVYSKGIVRRTGRWSVTRTEFPLQQYPDYVSGTSYVISGPLVPRLVHAAEYMPYLPLEDVFVTGCLARVTGAKLRPLDSFSKWSDSVPEPCRFFMQGKLTVTNVDSELRWNLWDVQNHFTDRCSLGSAAHDTTLQLGGNQTKIVAVRSDVC